MLYKKFHLFFILLLFSCVNNNLIKSKDPTTTNVFFINKGFTLVYNEKLFENISILISIFGA